MSKICTYEKHGSDSPAPMPARVQLRGHMSGTRLSGEEPKEVAEAQEASPVSSLERKLGLNFGARRMRADE